MSDPATPPAAPLPDASAKPTCNQRLGRWASVAIGFAALLIGGTKLVGFVTLPSCESDRSLDTVKSIFKDKNLPEPTLTDAQTITGDRSEKTCQTAYEIPNEKGTLDYKVFWDGWNAKVMITKVTN